MNVVLIDGMGAVREMAVEHIPVRVAVQRPFTVCEPIDPASVAEFSYVEFCDSGMVDRHNRMVLTPDGKSVPTSRVKMPLFRRGRQLYADVWLSDIERHSVALSLDRVLWEAARGPLRSMVEDPATGVVQLDVQSIERDGMRRIERFRVFAEERTLVNEAVMA